MERQSGEFFRHLSVKVSCLFSFEMILHLDVALVNGSRNGHLVELAFAGGDHDVNGKQLVLLELESGVVLHVLFLDLFRHWEGLGAVDDMLSHVAGHSAHHMVIW